MRHAVPTLPPKAADVLRLLPSSASIRPDCRRSRKFSFPPLVAPAPTQVLQRAFVQHIRECTWNVTIYYLTKKDKYIHRLFF